MSDKVCGERIKKMRLAFHMTPDQLAEEIGCTKRTIQRYENDFIIPDTYNLVKLSDFFNVTTDYLLGLSMLPNETSLRPPFFVLTSKANEGYRYLEIKNFGGKISNVKIMFYDIITFRNVRTSKSLNYMINGRYFQANESRKPLINYDYQSGSFKIIYNLSSFLTDNSLEENLEKYLCDDISLSINKVICIKYTDYKNEFAADYFKLDQHDSVIQMFDYIEESPLRYFRYIHLDSEDFSYLDKAHEISYLLKNLDFTIIYDKNTTQVFFND